ncbi:uncharacterized protein [Watersipora subatra]|uniref:uncharacterized protein n=1 Tax=Watersipora subatra TaxID=2589382 RepID=UPI00355C5E29
MTMFDYHTAEINKGGQLLTPAMHAYGAVGTRRPIVKRAASSTDRHNSISSGISHPPYSTNLPQYRLFENTQQPLPFSQYQQPFYNSHLQQTPAYLPAPPEQNTPFSHNNWPVLQQHNHADRTVSTPTARQTTSPKMLPSTSIDSDTHSPNSVNTLASALQDLQVSPLEDLSAETAGVEINSSDSDDDETEHTGTHPNKYPVEIEYHDNQQCGFRRQSTRSGPKMKQQQSTVYDPLTGQNVPQVHRIKYYQKHLVRICRCGKYSQMDGALVQGRANDCDGYEIHYSQKCKWKAYDDYKTGQRVLIRLCKCYKPPLVSLVFMALPTAFLLS